MYKKPHKQRGKTTMGPSPGGMPEFLDSSTVCTQGTWRIIPVSKWLVTPIYRPFRPFVKGITLLRGLTITMVISHLLNGMILQVYVLPLLLPTPARRDTSCPCTWRPWGLNKRSQETRESNPGRNPHGFL